MRGFMIPFMALLVSACASSGPRVGVIQVKVVMDESPWALGQVEALKKEISSREKILDEKCVEPLKKIEARLQELLDRPDADEEKTSVMMTKRQMYDGCVVMRSQMQDEISRIRDKFISDLMTKIGDGAGIVARRRKLDLVLLHQQQGPVVWSGPRVDITGEVKKIMDTEP
jgi:Skp family chaperone for outer membrane proteins